MHRAAAAFLRLSGSPKPLLFHLEYALANYREPERQKSLDEAIVAYVAEKTKERDQKLISPSQLTTIERHMNVLKKHFLGALVSDLTSSRLSPSLQRGKVSLKTYNNRRGLVSTFLKFASQQEWIAENPIKHSTSPHRLPPGLGQNPLCRTSPSIDGTR